MGGPTRSPAIAQRLVSAYITALRQHLPTSSIRQLDQLPAASEQQIAHLQRSYPGVPAELLCVLTRVNGTCWEALRVPLEAASTPTPAANREENETAVSTPSKTSPASAPSTSEGQKTTSCDAEKVKPPTLTATAASYLRATFRQGGAGQGMASEKKHVKIAVPILGSALGACPYYLMSVDQMLSAKPFLPPPWKNGARQPAYSDALSEDDAEIGQAHSASNSTEKAAGATPSATQGRGQHVEGCGGARSPYTIASLYEGYRVIQDLAVATAAAAERDQHNAAPTATNVSLGEAATGAHTATAPANPAPSAASTASQKLQKIINGEVGVSQGTGTAGGSLVPPLPPSATTAPPEAFATPASPGTTTAEPVRANSARTDHWVYVDPRIDTHADLNHWLGFADSIYPHHQREVEVRQQLKGVPGSPAGGPIPLPLYKTCESRLFVDFSPSPLGTPGQIVQFVRGGQKTSKKRLTLYPREAEEITTGTQADAGVASSKGVTGTAVTIGESDSFVVIASDFGEYLKDLIRDEYEFTEDLEDEEDEEDDDATHTASTAKKA